MDLTLYVTLDFFKIATEMKLAYPISMYHITATTVFNNIGI
mgnify:CR=1 FL=1